MSAPSEAEIKTQWQNAISLVDKIWRAGRTDATADNIIEMLDALVQSAESDFAPNIVNAAQSIRTSMASIIGQAGNVQLPLIQSYLRHVYNYYNLSDANEMLDRLYFEFANGAGRVKSRGFTFGAITEDPNTCGNAAINREDGGGNSQTAIEGFSSIKRRGKLKSVQVYSGAGGNAIIKVFRSVGVNWFYVGQSESFALGVGLTSRTLTSPINVEAGDYIGIYLVTTTVIDYALTGGAAYFISGDKTVTSLKSDWSYQPYIISLNGSVENRGSEQILRLNKDQYNYDIEVQHADTKRMRCVKDMSGGAPKWEEVFEFTGQSLGIDELDGIGSGQSKQIAAKSAKDSLLLNASFSSYSGALITTPTAIDDWTCNPAVSGTNYNIDETNYYRDYDGDTTPRSLLIKISASLTQKLSLRSTVLDWSTPHLCQLYYKPNGAIGTLTLALGTQSVSIVLAGGESDQWAVLRLPVDFNLWPKNFSEPDTDVVITWTKTSGNINIDEVLFTPLDEFDGAFYAVVPIDAGTPTQAIAEDKFYATDTETGSIIQYWLFRAFNKYLPHATGADVTFTDPT